MIAKNYLKFPEALRFQRELFGGSVKVSVRFARLMECIFSFTKETPQWAKDQARRMRELVKAWKSQMVEMFAAAERKSKPIKEFFSVF